MINLIKKLYKKWDEWENEEINIIWNEEIITTNNYTIQVFIIFLLLLYSIIFY